MARGKLELIKDGQFHFIHTKKAHRASEAIEFSIPKTRGTPGNCFIDFNASMKYSLFEVLILTFEALILRGDVGLQVPPLNPFSVSGH